MKSNRSRTACLAAFGVITVILLAVAGWTPLRIQYHRGYVTDARSPHERPESSREYFSFRTVRWLLKGRPSAEQNIQIGAEHEAALVKLGYFERRVYHGGRVDWRALNSELRTGALHDPLCFFRVRQDGTAEIVAHHNDFETIEHLIQKHGEKK